MAIGSIVCGVLALIMTVGGFLTTGVPILGSVFSFGAPVMGLVGVILGGISLSRAKQMNGSEGAALSGLIVSAIAFVLGLVVALTCGLCNACMSAGAVGAASGGGFPPPSSGALNPNPLPSNLYPQLNPLEEDRVSEAREELLSACAEPCPEDWFCAHPWCAREPQLKVRSLECVGDALCYVGVIDGARIASIEVRSNPTDLNTFASVLDTGLQAREVGALAPLGDPSEILSLLDSVCGDLWCEGEFDYRFVGLHCGTTRCRLEMTAQHYDDPSPTRLEMTIPRTPIGQIDDFPETLDTAVAAGIGAWEEDQEERRVPHGVVTDDVTAFGREALRELNRDGFDESGFSFRFSNLSCEGDACTLRYTVTHSRLGIDRDESMDIPRTALRRDGEGLIADTFFAFVADGLEAWMERNFDE